MEQSQSKKLRCSAVKTENLVVPENDSHPITSLQSRVSFLHGVKTHASIIHPAERVSTHESISSARRRISDALLDAGSQMRSVQSQSISTSASQSQPGASSSSSRIINPWCGWTTEERLFRWRRAGSGKL
jgi:hypothetical protein